VAPIVLSLVLEARVLAETEPDQAVDLAYAAARLPEQLLAVLHKDDSTRILQDLLAVRSLDFEVAGDMASRHGDHPVAAATYHASTRTRLMTSAAHLEPPRVLRCHQLPGQTPAQRQQVDCHRALPWCHSFY
jgi:hypothetical protein